MNAPFPDVPAASVADADDLSLWWPRPLPPSHPPLDRARRLGRDIASIPLVLRVSNVPSPATVAAVVGWKAEAAPLLARWKRTWDVLAASLEDALGDSDKNEGPANAARWTAEAMAARHAADETSVRGGKAPYHDKTASHLRILRMEIDPEAMEAWRDWRAHVLDDAETVASLVGCAEGRAWLQVQEGNAWRRIGRGPRGPVVVGTDKTSASTASGRPAQTIRTSVNAVLDAMSSFEERAYWKSPAFLAHAGRLFAPAEDEKEAVLVLLAMAREGRSRAFLKGAPGKSGTWTVDLQGILTPADAAGRLASAIFPGSFPTAEGAFVQEHLPFTHEQRFFVVGGRIAASVCSARSMTALDARRGRILDPRIARILRPEGESGTYDRGDCDVVEDRAMAAAFALKAREVVRALREEGWRDFVLDVGATERGILPVEINPMHMSGPYCLDRMRIVRAKDAAWRRTMDDLRRTAVELVADRVPADAVDSVVDKVLPHGELWSSLASRLLVAEKGPDGFGAGRLSERFAALVEEAVAAQLGTSVPSFLDPDLALEADPARWAERTVCALLPDWKPIFAVPVSKDVQRGLRDMLVGLSRDDDGQPRIALAVASHVRGVVRVDPAPIIHGGDLDLGPSGVRFFTAGSAVEVPGRYRVMLDHLGRTIQFVWTGAGIDAVLTVQVETEAGATVASLGLGPMFRSPRISQWKPSSKGAVLVDSRVFVKPTVPVAAKVAATVAEVDPTTAAYVEELFGEDGAGC